MTKSFVHGSIKATHGSVTEKKPNVTHGCGATSSKCHDLSQIPISALNALAKRFEHGEIKHGRNNWRKGLGDKKYTIERINHIIRHCYHLAATINDENPEDLGDTMMDDVGAILWGGAFLAEAVPKLESQ